ncbi:MAG TPA: MATE family efflux transporter [Steroidobacteraceae bacterium]|nr:MATE family efflux transporter [Steroidobacteraceae bacterium]
MSAPSHPFALHARAILHLGFPLVVGSMSVAGMNLANTLMAGHYSSAALAAVAVGQSYYGVHANFGNGALLALSALVAHAYGAGAGREVGEYARQAPWIVLGLAALLVASLWAAGAVFAAIGTDPSVVPAAVAYVHALACGLPGLLGFYALRYVSDGLGRTRPMMVIALAGLLANVLGNWLLMYGHWGLPALGAVGCGAATAAAQWLMFAAMFAYVRGHPAYRPYGLFEGRRRPSWPRIAEVLRLGIPISGSVVAETALFSAAGLMMGTLGAEVVAAHQIALNYASFTFTMPLALAAATTVHVGHTLGRGAPADAGVAGRAGITLCMLLMVGSALTLVVARRPIAALYSPDPVVASLAATLLVFVAVFQVSDGLQVGAMGALRGFKDTRVPLAITIAAYWLVGFPVAFVLGLKRGGGPAYVWSGLIAGLAVSALALNLRYRSRSRRAAAGL